MARCRLLPLLGLISLLCVSAAFAQTPPTAADIQRLAQANEAADKDFSGAQAPGLILQRTTLIGTNLRGADLRGARFVNVSLEQVNLRGANLRGAIFERVDLQGADLTGADLSGAMLIVCNIEGTLLGEARMDGAAFEGTGLSQTGAPYLAALHIALEQASGRRRGAALKIDEANPKPAETQSAVGEPFTRAWIAGLSGDAFAFAYNERNTGHWPGVPFVANPLLAAATSLGLTATFERGAVAERSFFDEDPKAPPAVFLLALKLPDVDSRLTQDRPLWALLAGREEQENGQMVYTFSVPPFGKREYLRADLMEKVWLGPWETPEPAGSMFPSHRQLAKILVGVPRPVPDQARMALKQAAAIITDKRTYGPLTPGEAGLMRLASDLRAVAESLDPDKARQLVPWQVFPRNCLIGSLGLATEFLAEAGSALPEAQAASCQEARLVLRSAMTALDTRWPPLSAGPDKLTQEQAAAFAQAADLIVDIAAAERKAAALFATIGA
jgi:hypothetical protein